MQNSLQVRKWVPLTLLVISFLGFVDAAYLSAKHLQGETPNCVFFSGCDIVTTSKYAVMFGIPVAVLGALFYLSVFLLSLAYLDRRNPRLLDFILYLSAPSILFTVYLVYLQVAVIHATCIYCMFSALTSTSIFALSVFRFQKTPVLPTLPV